ncbi:BrnT family toxin [Marinomonas arctica]
MAMGQIDERIHVLVFTVRGEVIRVISLRKANKKEVKHYENQTRND